MIPDLTSYYHRPCHCVRGAADACEIDVHRVNDILKVKRNFNVEDLTKTMSDYTNACENSESHYLCSDQQRESSSDSQLSSPITLHQLSPNPTVHIDNPIPLATNTLPGLS